MKNWITLFLALLPLNLFGQNRQPKELGIGFVIASNPYQFEDLPIPGSLYKDKDLTRKWNSDNVYPFFLKPDYGLFHFICLEETLDHYKILVNDTEIGYLPNDSNYYFKTWDAMLLQSTVERVTKENPIRKEWSNESEIIKNDCEFDHLTIHDVLQRDGEFWLQIYFSPECENYPNKDSKVLYS